jgi:hypothetical protein
MVVVSLQLDQDFHRAGPGCVLQRLALEIASEKDLQRHHQPEFAKIQQQQVLKDTLLMILVPRPSV